MAGLFGSGSPPNYIENADFLIGSNPIVNVLQLWLNTTLYPLVFKKVTGSPSTGTGHPSTYTISDTAFYGLIAVTIDVSNVGFFNDYGWPGSSLGAGGVNALGSGFVVGDQFSITGTSGGTGAVGQVTSAVSGGHVLGYKVINGGSGYVNGDTGTTTALTGGGSGLTVKNLAVGIPYDDTSEYPMWNSSFHGPDLIDAGYHKYWPFIYKWLPTDGRTVYFSSASFDDLLPIDGYSGTANFYYAAKSPALGFNTPLAQACLEFESQLGNNSSVYAPAPLQRIQYPWYAGVGSAHIDCGSAAALPQMRLEVQGSFSKYPPRGDADFSDMIEDIMKSGMIQTGEALGFIHRGVALNELPGATDKLCYTAGEPTGGSFYYPFMQPIQQNQIICAFSRWIFGGQSGSVSMGADTNANTWIPVMVEPGTGANCGFWYAFANGNYPADTEQLNVVAAPTGTPYQQTSFAWVMDPSLTVVEATATANGGPPGVAPYIVGCSITVTQPCWIVACATQSAGSFEVPYAVDPKWQELFPGVNENPQMQNQLTAGVWYMYAESAGTYTFQYAMTQNSSWQIGMLALAQGGTPSQFAGMLGNILDRKTMINARQQCQANGLIGSLTCNAQKPAGDWMKDIYQCMDTAPVWAGDTLLSIALSEASAVGNGVVFVTPTADGPVLNVKESNMVRANDPNAPLVTVKRKGQTDQNNIAQIQFFDRGANYNPETVSEPYGPTISSFAPRKEDPQDLPMIQDPSVARKILAIKVREYNLLRNLYIFTGQAGLIALLPGDLITIDDSQLGISGLPVRVIKVEEKDNFELDFTCEPFIYGCRAPQVLAVTSTQPNSLNITGDPGSVNTPIIFEPVPRLVSQTNVAQLGFIVSGASTSYGGCIVMVSIDGGTSYTQLGIINGNAVTGYTVGDWPSHNDPDTVNNLSVDLTESLGSLENYDAAERDAFAFPFYVSSGNACVPYGLGSYNDAVLTAPYMYTIMATGTGNEIRRGVWGAPGPTIGADVDHPNGSRFAFVNPTSGNGSLYVNLDQTWIGKTIFFKFLAFNTFGSQIQDQSAATAYSFTPTGCPFGLNNPNTANYTISGGALTNPTSTSIHMAQATANFPANSANYNARTFTITNPSVPTTYYVTIYDPGQVGDTGSATNLTATCSTATTNVGAPGYIYIGSIVALPGGGGTETGSGGGNVGVTGGQVLINGV